MNSPIQFETVAKSQYADRLHEAEIARLTKNNNDGRFGSKVAQIVLVVSGIATVMSILL